MYMTKRHYVKNWDHNIANFKVTVKRDNKAIPGLDESKISYVIEDVAYWRKANAIHKWFVENVQNGEDDCREYYVDDDQLEKLVALCKKVVETAKIGKGKVLIGQGFEDGKWADILEDGETITNPEEIHKILPTESGFFFGSTQYDEYYLQDIKDTIKQLEPLLEKDEKGDYINRAEVYYRASW